MIVAGERDACKSHGIHRIESALRTVKAGKVKPDAVPELLLQEGSAIVKVNAEGGFANPAFELGLHRRSWDDARSCGLAALVINGCTHFSARWSEAEGLTEQELAAPGHVPELCNRCADRRQQTAAQPQPFAFAWPRVGQPP